MNDALPAHAPLELIEAVDLGLGAAGYIASRQISTAIYLAHHLQKPILVEGPAGVGKTELAKSVATWMKLPLIRMQCYEGLDESKALYEWKYGKQLALHPDPEGQDQLGDRRATTISPWRWTSCTISATSSSRTSSWSRGRCCARWSSRAARSC